MKNAPVPAAPTNLSNTSTEDLLDGLIAEVHAVIREIALPAVVGAEDDSERRRYLATVMELVRTGAAVGEAVAKLRPGSEARQKITVERLERLVPPGVRS
jgi:hypothetical protein